MINFLSSAVYVICLGVMDGTESIQTEDMDSRESPWGGRNISIYHGSGNCISCRFTSPCIDKSWSWLSLTMFPCKIALTEDGTLLVAVSKTILEDFIIDLGGLDFWKPWFLHIMPVLLARILRNCVGFKIIGFIQSFYIKMTIM